MKNRTRIKVFYDGGCALCSREISHYSKLSQEQSRVQWIDITQEPDLLAALGVTVDEAMRRLHVLDTGGLIRDGADAFVTLWSELPYYRYLAKVVCVTRTVGVIEACYRPFAGWRYNRRMRHGACPIGIESKRRS